MKITKPLTAAIDQASRYVSLLKQNSDIFLKGGFWKRSSFEERKGYFSELASAEAVLWSLIRKTYPESEGRSISVTQTGLAWEVPDDETKQVITPTI